MQELLQDKLPKQFRERWPAVAFVAVLFSTAQAGSARLLQSTIAQSKAVFEKSGIVCFAHSKSRKEALIDKQVFFPYLFRADRRFNFHVPSKDDPHVLFEELANFHDLCELNSVLITNKQYNHLRAEEVDDWLRAHPHLDAADQVRNILTSTKNVGLTLTLSFRSHPFRDFGRSDQHIFKVSDPRAVDDLSRLYFGPASKDYMLCCVLLRPLVVSSGVEELFLNVFRINEFTVVRRAYKKLDDYELNYLAKLEGVEEESFDNYCQMMTTGPVCFVVLANYCAVSLANFLANGFKDFDAQGKYCDNSKAEVERDSHVLLDLLVQAKNRPRETVLEEFLQSDASSAFRGLANLINYNYVFYRDLVFEVTPNLFQVTHPSDKFMNQRTVRKSFENHREYFSACSFFNPNLFVPASETACDELISIFMPQALTKTSCVLVVHPLYFEFADSVVDCLKSLE